MRWALTFFPSDGDRAYDSRSHRLTSRSAHLYIASDVCVLRSRNGAVNKALSQFVGGAF